MIFCFENGVVIHHDAPSYVLLYNHSKQVIRLVMSGRSLNFADGSVTKSGLQFVEDTSALDIKAVNVVLAHH